MSVLAISLLLFLQRLSFINSRSLSTGAFLVVPPTALTGMTSSSNETSAAAPIFHVVSEKMVYDGWRKVVKKEIIFPNKKSVIFDVITNQPAVSVFVWDSKSATATLIQEFHPGVEKLMFGVVAGGFEDHKHSSLLKCAVLELEEEAHLSTNTWIPLLQSGEDNHQGGVPFEKYANQFIHPYLALDCEKVSNPKPIDAEEYIVIHEKVTYRRIMEMIGKGEMNTLSAYTSLLAFNKLREMGIPLENLATE